MTASSLTVRIGSKSFVPKLVDSLFKPVDGRTADGEYRRVKGGVVFVKPNGEPFAALVLREPHFVSAHRCYNGRTRYLYGLSEVDADRLGLPASHVEQKRIAEQITADLQE